MKQTNNVMDELTDTQTNKQTSGQQSNDDYKLQVEILKYDIGEIIIDAHNSIKENIFHYSGIFQFRMSNPLPTKK